jgi:FkbM family methyltransferase
MNPQLIYDVGMHNGDDSAYYLHRGFNVVAVEADPDLAEAAKARFAKEIASGRLTIVNAAIADKRGEADFWICEQLRVWNSFDKSIASRNGLPCHSVKVQTIPLRDLFSKHGVPFYLKLDIEGNDHIAAADVSCQDAPEFISLEINSADDFWLLRSKGYKRFKCIQQGYFKQVLSPRLSLKSAVNACVTRLKSKPMMNYVREAIQSRRTVREAPSEPENWVFSPGSSGPFGNETSGEWQSFEEALHAWLSQQLGHNLGYRNQPPGINEWYDLHGSLE